MGDLIFRQQAIDEIMSLIEEPDDDFNEGVRNSAVVIYQLPSAQPERPEQPESAREYCAECDHIEMCRWYPYEGCEFRSLLSAQPRKKGKWILETFQIRCSECNKLFSDNLFPSKYCPSCGARMDGESDE